MVSHATYDTFLKPKSTKFICTGVEAVCAVDEDERDVPVGLLVVVKQVAEDGVIVGVEYESGHGAHLGEDVSGYCPVTEIKFCSVHSE